MLCVRDRVRMVMLRAAPSDGRRYDELLRANRTSPDRAPWWLPAMVHLAMAEPDVSEQARSVLRKWAARRFDFVYAVVQEETDDHMSLTASAWPLVDDRGRLRFRTTDDPVECHAERPELQAFVDGHRARWHASGWWAPSRRRDRSGWVMSSRSPWCAPTAR